MMTSTRSRQAALQRSRALFLLVLWCLGVIPAQLIAAPVPENKPAHYPGWWFEREVIKRTNAQQANPTWPADYPQADDYAAANIGQLKSIASKAVAEFDAKLPGGAGATLSSLIAGWQSQPAAGVTRDDFAALNLGQLKSVAKPFYDRLIGVQLATGYPWAGSANQPDDYANANLGQLKAVFSFTIGVDPFSMDSDGDGISDGDEILSGSTGGGSTGTDPRLKDNPLLQLSAFGFATP